MVPTLEQQIEEILVYFDFQTVQDYMKLKTRKEYDDDFVTVVDTTPWLIRTERGMQIPTVIELKELALKLMRELIRLHKANPDQVYHSLRTGPFLVTYRYGMIQLDAVIEFYSYD